MRELIEQEILTLLEEQRDVLTERLSARLLERAGGRMDRAQQAPRTASWMWNACSAITRNPLNSAADVSNGHLSDEEKHER